MLFEINDEQIKELENEMELWKNSVHQETNQETEQVINQEYL